MYCTIFSNQLLKRRIKQFILIIPGSIYFTEFLVFYKSYFCLTEIPKALHVTEDRLQSRAASTQRGGRHWPSSPASGEGPRGRPPALHFSALVHHVPCSSGSRGLTARWASVIEGVRDLVRAQGPDENVGL